MGYTHYWDIDRDFSMEEWTGIMDDFRAILRSLPEHSKSAGGYYESDPLEIVWPGGGKLVVSKKDGTVLGLPICTTEEIAFNGGGGKLEKTDPKHRPVYDLSHESFVLTRENGTRDFCKTARKPYDLVVCALLISAKVRAPDAIRIRSDGRQEDWKPALEFVRLELAPTWPQNVRINFTKGYIVGPWLGYANKSEKTDMQDRQERE